MAKYLVLALTNPLPGREKEFNDWYDNTALPMYRSIPGLKPLGRYKLAGVPPSFPFEMRDQWEYLSVYEFETDDYPGFISKVRATIEASKTYRFSEAIDKTRFYEPVFMAL
jgi:hypothetical protein